MYLNVKTYIHDKYFIIVLTTIKYSTYKVFFSYLYKLLYEYYRSAVKYNPWNILNKFEGVKNI